MAKFLSSKISTSWPRHRQPHALRPYSKLLGRRGVSKLFAASPALGERLRAALA